MVIIVVGCSKLTIVPYHTKRIRLSLVHIFLLALTYNCRPRTCLCYKSFFALCLTFRFILHSAKNVAQIAVVSSSVLYFAIGTGRLLCQSSSYPWWSQRQHLQSVELEEILWMKQCSTIVFLGSFFANGRRICHYLCGTHHSRAL